METAFVSGASSGFGRAIAHLLAGQGYRVIAAARRSDRLVEVAEAYPGLPIFPLVVDLTDRDALRIAIETLPAPYKDVSVVVNNAGVSRGFGPMQESGMDAWRDMVETNIMGALNLIDILLPRLVRRGGGHVLNVGSIAAHYPYLGSNVYGATKAFVHQLSLNMRTDLQGTGVRVSCVAPGAAETEFALVRYDGDRNRARKTYEGFTPLTAFDVASVVLWCLEQPPHVNVNMVEVMPTEQAFGLGFGGGPKQSKGERQ